jgi:NAD(P)-dependent dehydrogenase (short-subunit alcohol dehydrogenase family)
MELQSKVVLITGGAIRIGRAISIELANAGCLVCCHYLRSRESAESLQREIEKQTGTIHLFETDLTKNNAPQNLIQKVIDKFNKIDVLINNAAIFLKTPFGKITFQDWDKLHNLNLRAAFFLAQEAGMQMKKQGSGKIINIGDAGAETPFPAYLPYSITKAGIVTMTKGLAKALAPKVQVNCINPGPVLFPDHYTQEEKNFALEHTLLKREGSAEDIARAVRFLLQDSDFITGAIIPVDGGRQIR